MGIRRSAIEQAADNDPYVKHKPRGAGANDIFKSTAILAATGRTGSASLVVPVNRKPGRNKATK